MIVGVDAMAKHVVRPLHGWRAFAGEVGVVVLGVLIALAAGQAVDALNWHNQVKDARAALGTELADSIGQGFERQHFYDCAERRLDDISRVLDSASRTGRLPPLGAIGMPQPRTWLDSTWQTTMNGQTASHFTRRDLSLYGILYMFIADVREQAHRELIIWANLYTIVGPGRATTPAEIEGLRRDVSQARLLNRSIMFESTRVRQYADSAGIRYDADAVKVYADAPAATFEICQPGGARIPANYGSAPLDGALEAVRTRSVVLPQ